MVGYFNGVIETKNKIVSAKFYFVRGNHMNSLLGLETASNLEIIKIVNKISDKIEGLPSPLWKIINEHKSRFVGIEKLKDVKVNLSINPEIQPAANKQRREKVDAELNRLMEAGVI